MENHPVPNQPGENPRPAPQKTVGANTPPAEAARRGAPPEEPPFPMQMPPAVAEKVASARLRSLGNRSSGLLLLTQLMAGAVMFAILILRSVLLFRNSSASPAELMKELSPTGNLMILFNYLATFWGMVLCLLIARSMLRQEIFSRWRRPQTPPLFLAESALLMFGAVGAGEIVFGVVNAVFRWFGISNGTPNFSLKGDRVTDTVLVVYVCILAPILEETLFRGMILQKLRPWGETFAVGASALLFAVFHMNLIQGIAAFFMGLVLGLIAVRSESVLPCIFVHFLNNTLSMALIAAGIQTSSVLEAAYFSFLGVCLLASAVLLFSRRADFALSSGQQPEAPPAAHPFRSFFLSSAWFWVLAALFAAACVILAFSPQSGLLQKIS